MPMSNKSIAVLIGCLGLLDLSVLGCAGLFLAGLFLRVENTTVTSQPMPPVRIIQVPTSSSPDGTIDLRVPPIEAGSPSAPTSPATAPSGTKTPAKAESDGDQLP